MAEHEEHGSGCGHQHGTLTVVDDSVGRSLRLAMWLNLFIPLCQIVGGIMAQSMAVISDAVHNLGDFTSLLVAYVAHRIGKKDPTEDYTYGYRRVEVLAALLNVALIFGVCLFILFETAARLQAPPEHISGGLVAALAAIGIVGNGISFLFLRREAEHSLNVRGAMLHMLADLMTSVAVLVGGLVMIYQPWYWLDAVLSLFIVAFIIKSSWPILIQAARILMEGTPPGMELEVVRRELEAVSGVENAHHLHVWNIGPDTYSFTCHIVVPEQALSETKLLGERLRAMLAEKFHILHAVFEFENLPCGENDILCRMGRTSQQGK